MVKGIYWLIFIGNPLILFGQQRLSGYVEDADSGERLFGASVWVAGTSQGTTTNFYGYFSLLSAEENAVLKVSYVGYEPIEIAITDQDPFALLIKLDPLGDLEEVTITSSRELPPERQAQVSAVSIPIKQIQQLPAVGGEVDLMRGLQLLPGVQSGREGLTGLYVRGGGPDQNLILLDGIPLYNVSHLGGIFSVFNPDILSDVNLIKGGFPARYGGRLSSVLNIKVREGNRNETQTQGAIGLASARLSHEGPITKGKGSYLLAMRRSYIDAFTRPISRITSGGETSFGYTFYDLNGKINYDLSGKDKVYASVYTGHDRAVVNTSSSDDIKASSNFQWGNVLATARWNRLVSDRIFTNLSLGYTRYNYSIGFDQEELDTDNAFLFNYSSGIEDLSLRYDWEFYLNNKHSLRTGLHFTEHFFTPGVNLFRTQQETVKTDTVFGSFNVNARELSVYVEDDWEISKRLRMNLGLHLNGYHVNGANYLSPQPRVTASYMTGARSAVKLSYAQMQQNVHLLSSSGAGLPTDLWVPATERTAPQFSSQITAAYNKSFSGGYEASAEVYYKTMDNLIAYSDGVNWLEGAEDWQDKIERNGQGLSRGLELFLHKKEGRFTGWIGYTLAKSDLQFETINEGRSFPDRFDRRHDVGLFLNYEINKRVSVSGTWVYGTGNAITLGQSRYMGVAEGIPNLSDQRFGFNRHVEYYEGRNNFRMRAYHRADVGIRFTKPKKWGERTWNLGFYNAYSRANPFYYYWSNQSLFFFNSADDSRSLRQIALFPIIPSFSYEFKF
ncbi:TonB-dependent receptor [Lunatibacter salilacus]|uniref:TonB-dependent receptor n=1 Tax=Lunatibacter salilacus TaxID=2483804 RepID=UPI00131BB8D4|nr:TonB-dependent receptor [Lunatibacter salilacus]